MIRALLSDALTMILLISIFFLLCAFAAALGPCDPRDEMALWAGECDE